MTHVLTLISSTDNGLQDDLFTAIENKIAPTRKNWLKQGKAIDLFFSSAAINDLASVMQPQFDDAKIDAVLQADHDTRRKQLLCADMDSTLIEQEGLDLIAAHIGLQEETAAITERAMCGEIDFAASLTERVSLLKGLDASKLDDTFAQLSHTPGARTLVQTMRDNGAKCILISGGFTCFADKIAEQLGCDEAHSNILDIKDGKLAGTVTPPIVDSARKREILLSEQEERHLSPGQILAVGDGANDIPMLQSAGMGVAFRAKPATEAATQYRIRYNDLHALLYIQGYDEDSFVS